MNDWLSKIEQTNKESREEADAIFEVPLIETPQERMARVIRELAGYVNASHAVEKACAQWNPVNIRNLRRRKSNAQNNLSPDAKELLEL